MNAGLGFLIVVATVIYGVVVVVFCCGEKTTALYLKTTTCNYKSCFRT